MKGETVMNALSGAAQSVVNTALVVFIVPVFIDRLGIEAYAIYALVTALTGLGLFTNFGLTTSLMKFLAEGTDRSETSADIVVTFIIVVGSTLLVSLGALLLEDVVLSGLLNIKEELLGPSSRTFYAAVVGAGLFQVAGQIPAAVLDSRQKIYITNGVQLGVGVVSKALILVSLLSGGGLATVGWILFVSSVASAALLGWFGWKLWGPLAVSGLPERFIRVAKKHLRYGRSIYATTVMGSLYDGVARILISHSVGISAVAYFDVAIKVKGAIWSVLERLLYPVLPILAGKSLVEEIGELLQDMEHKLIILVVPLIVMVAFLAHPLVSIWLGGPNDPVSWSIVFIVDSYLVALVFVPAYHFLTIKGYPHLTLVLQSMNLVVSSLLIFLLVPVIGYYGAVTGYCLAVVASSVLCSRYQWTILKKGPVPSWESVVRILVLAAVMILLNLTLEAIAVAEYAFWALLANVTASVLLVRALGLMTSGDISRYTSGRGKLRSILVKVLVRGNS